MQILFYFLSPLLQRYIYIHSVIFKVTWKILYLDIHILYEIILPNIKLWLNVRVVIHFLSMLYTLFLHRS